MAVTQPPCASVSITVPMPSPDFPTELWLEILSYLPPSYVLKLLGVSRILFELALD